MFRPDWQYLQDHLYWLHDRVTDCSERQDFEQAERYLDDMAQIMRSLQSVLDTGDLPKS